MLEIANRAGNLLRHGSWLLVVTIIAFESCNPTNLITSTYGFRLMRARGAGKRRIQKRPNSKSTSAVISIDLNGTFKDADQCLLGG